jgi:hypothetical protein
VSRHTRKDVVNKVDQIFPDIPVIDIINTCRLNHTSPADAQKVLSEEAQESLARAKQLAKGHPEALVFLKEKKIALYGGKVRRVALKGGR